MNWVKIRQIRKKVAAGAVYLLPTTLQVRNLAVLFLLVNFMRTGSSHRRVWTSGVWVRRCAPLWMLVAILSCLLTVPLGSAAGGTTRAPAEEESNETPTEEDAESLVCPLSRDDFFEGQSRPAVKPLIAVPRRVGKRPDWRAARPAEVAARNGCGGPLRC